MTTTAPPPSRTDRRRARTRGALIAAARQILAERGTVDVSIQEITDSADVGFGSFYNHFSSKEELFEQAVAEVLEQHGAYLDRLTAGLDDPAEVFAASLRLTGRLATTQPAAARILTQTGLSYLIADDGLAPRALRDIQRATEAGRFQVSNPTVALASTGGCLLAFLQLRLQRPDLVTDEDADEMAEQVLRMLGMSAAAARRLAHRPLPQVA
ncbi:MAG: helix-turn-helix domain-containing protein [Candidatus Nanopelagicales bacterium]